ncbi:MAG: hypothetical protein NC415_12320, partial [bacterium]|nr:hypothetical protein [bacterium]
YAIVANAEDSRCRIAGVRVRLPRREVITLILSPSLSLRGGFLITPFGAKIYKEVMSWQKWN